MLISYPLLDIDNMYQCIVGPKPDHLTCLLKNLYAGQEATDRTGHGTTDWFQIGKGVKAVYCHSAYLTYMQNIS